ncbi:hypothetical protein LXL04_020681 [Taraxacum kok-saghyz]
MPASPAMRFSPGREPRADNHKRGRSLGNGVIFKEIDDDLALFNEVQSRERDNFLLQSNDDFDDTFGTKLRDFSDHKLGINITARGETSDFLNTEEEKNDYEWLLTPPDTPLFPSLDDDPPLPQRGRPRAPPISISRSSTMEKSRRSSRGSQSPDRLTPSPRPSIKPSRTPPRSSTPTSRRLSSGSPSPTTSISTTRGISGISPGKTTRGNSASPKIRAWQANIPGFSTEAPPNLRTCLADRPASYVRGSSPASRNSRQSMSPTPSRSISSSHSHDRDRFSPRSKGSIASSGDDDVESLPSIVLDNSHRLNSRKVNTFRNSHNNNSRPSFSQKSTRAVSSNSAPKRSFDLALRQMDQKRVAQNRFRPLLSSVPTSTFYAGKPTPAWNSSVTTSSNASSDVPTTSTHEIQETEPNDDEASSRYVKEQDSTILDDQVFILEKTNEDTGNETPEISSSLEFENLADCDTAVSDHFKEVEVEPLKDTLLCSRCGFSFSDIIPNQDHIKLCENCQNFPELPMPDVHDESLNTMNPPDEVKSIQVTQFQDLEKDGYVEVEPISESQLEKEEEEVNHQVISHTKVESSLVFKKSNSIKDIVMRSGNFSASSISYDDLSYVRESTNSMRSSFGGRGSLSASSSFDFGPKSQSTNKKPQHHTRSLSSFSGTSNHALNPPSVGTSTLDSFDVHVIKDVADVASQETVHEHEHDTWTETENEDVDNVGVDFCSNSAPPEDSLHESSNFEDLNKDDNEEDICVEELEVELSVISEGENDQTCSHESQSDVAPQELHVGDASHDSTTINDESLVVIESEGKTKGRSLTLEEATDTILFCSSIVHNLAYEAATLSIQNQTPSHPDVSEKLIPALGKGRKEVHIQTKQKTKQKKATAKPPPNNHHHHTDTTNEETDFGKPRIVYPNNKENRRPPKLESKCNCSIM